jgi:hypothetical protein
VENDPLVLALAEALRNLIGFVSTRPDDASIDDDVRALEDVAWTLKQVPSRHQDRLIRLLGAGTSAALGLADTG